MQHMKVDSEKVWRFHLLNYYDVIIVYFQPLGSYVCVWFLFFFLLIYCVRVQIRWKKNMSFINTIIIVIIIIGSRSSGIIIVIHLFDNI